MWGDVWADNVVNPYRVAGTSDPTGYVGQGDLAPGDPNNVNEDIDWSLEASKSANCPSCFLIAKSTTDGATAPSGSPAGVTNVGGNPGSSNGPMPDSSKSPANSQSGTAGIPNNLSSSVSNSPDDQAAANTASQNIPAGGVGQDGSTIGDTLVAANDGNSSRPWSDLAKKLGGKMVIGVMPIPVGDDPVFLDIDGAESSIANAAENATSGAAKETAPSEAGDVSQGPRFARGKLREQVLDKGRQSDGSVVCSYCGKTTSNPQSDHVIPYSRGGPTTLNNLVPACIECNLGKGSKLLEDWKPQQ